MYICDISVGIWSCRSNIWRAHCLAFVWTYWSSGNPHAEWIA